MAPDGKRNRSRGALGSKLVQKLLDPLLAAALPSVLRAQGYFAQSENQLGAVDQEGPAQLISLKLMHQFDSAAPAHAEETFDSGTVYDRGGEVLEISYDLRKSMKPNGLGRHGKILASLYVSARMCTMLLG